VTGTVCLWWPCADRGTQHRRGSDQHRAIDADRFNSVRSTRRYNQQRNPVFVGTVSEWWPWVVLIRIKKAEPIVWQPSRTKRSIS